MSELPGKKSKNQNIQVFVRLRPINAREKEIKSYTVVETCGNKEVVVRQTPLEGRHTKKFTFDRAFGPSSTQIEVYKTVVSPLIEEVLQGYSCTVFAYGQTGTGKTFTMAGASPVSSEMDSASGHRSWQSDPLTGIIPRALSQLFDELRLAQLEFTIRVSYLELYNEELFDLLAPSIDEQSPNKIRIFDDPTKKGSVIVQGLEEVLVKSKGEVYKIMADGQEKRKTAATLMNAQSSRSHTVFSILVHIKEVNLTGEAMLKTGKLNLVDLAGSENISKAGNDKKERARETVNINQSLLTLGRVISALVERTPHVPYRESKLTRLLQDSLGGRTKTSIIATISPGHKDLDETMSTLDYAHRAKNITNKPEINQKLTQKLALKGYTDEIDRLKRELCSQRERTGVYLPNEKYEDMVMKISHQDNEIAHNISKLRVYEEEKQKIMAIYENLRGSLVRTRHKLNSTKNTLNVVQEEFKETKKTLKKTESVCEEKSYIIEVQAKTEQVLSKQALDLLNVAEIATEDTNKLQSVIETRRKIDQVIKSSAEAFNDRMKRSIGNVKDAVDERCVDYLNKTEENRENLGELEDINSRASEKIIETVQQSVKEVRAILEKLTSMNESKSSKMISTFRALTHGNSCVIHECEDDISTAQSGKLRILTDEITSTYGARTDHIYDLANSLRATAVENKELMEKYKFANVNQNIDLKLMLQEIFPFLEEIAQNPGGTVIPEAVLSYINSKNEIMSQVSTNLESAEGIIEGYSANHRSMIDKIDRFTSCSNDLNKKQMKIFDAVSEQCDEMIGRMRAALSKIDNRSTSECEYLIDDMKQFHQDAISQFKACHNVLNSRLDDLIVLINKEFDIMAHHVTDLDIKSKDLKRAFGKFSEFTGSSLDDIAKDIEQYCSVELEVYKTTGETPVKKTHTINKDLAATSPYERILQRFRNERNNTLNESLDASIIELDESISEDPDMTMVSDAFVPDTDVRNTSGARRSLTRCASETDLSEPAKRQDDQLLPYKMTKSASAIDFLDFDIIPAIGKENIQSERPKSATKYNRHISSIPIQRREHHVLKSSNK